MFARPIRILAVLTVALASFPSTAQWYLGASAGQSRASFRGGDASEQLLDLGFDAASTSTDRSDVAYRVFGGYRLHRYVAVELAYADLGRFRMRSDVLPAGALNTSIRTDGAEANVVGIWPTWDRLSLMARAGVFNARTRARYDAEGSVLLIDGATRQSHRNTRPVYGVGLLYDISPRLGLRGEWSRYSKLGNDLTGGEFDVRNWLLGVQWRY